MVWDALVHSRWGRVFGAAPDGRERMDVTLRREASRSGYWMSTTIHGSFDSEREELSLHIPAVKVADLTTWAHHGTCDGGGSGICN